MKFALWLSSILILSSCGQSGSRQQFQSSSNPLHGPRPKTSVSTQDGTYVAVLNPVNGDHLGYSSGAVTINISNDEMITNIRFSGHSPGTVHAQIIHSGGFCPNDIADVNQDGYVDVAETLPYSSQFLIPLDSDLNSQAGGQGYYPLSDNWDSYIYSLVNSFSALMSDLHAPDQNPDDGLVKLNPISPLLLEERVVIIYGALDSLTLPSTVSSLPGLSPNQSIPIACGQFNKIVKAPGTPLPDEVTTPDPTASRPNPTGARPHGDSVHRPNRPQSPVSERLPEVTRNPHLPERPGSPSTEHRPQRRGNDQDRGPVCRDKAC